VCLPGDMLVPVTVELMGHYTYGTSAIRLVKSVEKKQNLLIQIA